MVDCACCRYQLTNRVHTDTDLVVIMTTRPRPHHKLSGFAFCVQHDQHHRCTVGVFNWVPNVVSVADQLLPASIASERHTALHEVIHILGGIFGYGPFIDDNGNRKTMGNFVIERDSVGYNKPATKIVTPKVLAVVREQFKCPAMSGMPIEDQPTGKGAHWEARLMGPEVMSYGSGTGEVYMSDLTWAYLEDTKQYIANYSITGPLVETTGDTSSDTEFTVELTETPTAQYGPGYLRWGRDQGCDFVNGNARDWDERYFCSTHREFTCSYDNRMSAVCDIRSNWQVPLQYVVAYAVVRVCRCASVVVRVRVLVQVTMVRGRELSVLACHAHPVSCHAPRYTCGTQLSGGSMDCNAQLNTNCDMSGCYLPTIYQHFTAQTAGAAAGSGASPSRTGGFSSAMDYVPVRIGYWNCQNAAPSSNASTAVANEGSDVDLGSLTQGTEEKMRLFGGQAYCKNCRCFVSSLMEFSSGKVDPSFPRFGLCYRSNCFRKDYLQFAIQDQIGGDVTWYKCPSGGGKLYIAGFSGAFHCPVASEFCRCVFRGGVCV